MLHLISIFSLLLAGAPVADDGPRVKRLNAMAGDLNFLLKIEVESATNDGRVAVAMMDAEWCGICKRFKRLLAHPRLKDVLGNVNLLAIDVDEWGHRALKDGGFGFRKIPAFFHLTAQGGPKGKPMTSRAWRDLTPKHVAESFKKFLARRESERL